MANSENTNVSATPKPTPPKPTPPPMAKAPSSVIYQNAAS